MAFALVRVSKDGTDVEGFMSVDMALYSALKYYHKNLKMFVIEYHGEMLYDDKTDFEKEYQVVVPDCEHFFEYIYKHGNKE